MTLSSDEEANPIVKDVSHQEAASLASSVAGKGDPGVALEELVKATATLQ